MILNFLKLKIKSITFGYLGMVYQFYFYNFEKKKIKKFDKKLLLLWLIKIINIKIGFLVTRNQS